MVNSEKKKGKYSCLEFLVQSIADDSEDGGFLLNSHDLRMRTQTDTWKEGGGYLRILLSNAFLKRNNGGLELGILLLDGLVLLGQVLAFLVQLDDAAFEGHSLGVALLELDLKRDNIIFKRDILDDQLATSLLGHVEVGCGRGELFLEGLDTFVGLIEATASI